MLQDGWSLVALRHAGTVDQIDLLVQAYYYKRCNIHSLFL